MDHRTRQQYLQGHDGRRAVTTAERWLDSLPDGSVVGAYDPHMKGAPGHKVGTAWMWRKEHGEWVIVGGGYHGTAYVATHPNLTLIYNPHRPPHVGTLTPAQLADLDPHDRQAREATEQ